MITSDAGTEKVHLPNFGEGFMEEKFITPSWCDSEVNITRIDKENEGRTSVQTHVLKVWVSTGCTCFVEEPSALDGWR